MPFSPTPFMAQKPQQNPKSRRHTTCHRHPDTPTTTGLCAPCLRERLSLLHPSTSSATAPSPELRRCKTFSATNLAGVSLEPRRRSCDVRARNSLSTLFDIDDDSGANEVSNVESSNLGFLNQCNVEARVSDFEDSKTMKEFIDLEFQTQGNSKISNNNNRKDFREIAGSFWIVAKKLRKWRKKQDSRRDSSVSNGDGLGEMQLDRLRGRRLRDTQSEIGDLDHPRSSIDFGRASVDCGAFGVSRRSCDTDPRFSIDLGRASIDCARVSIDEGCCSYDAPRASWDGYLLGRRAAPVVSVIENAMATVYGFDHHRVVADGKVKIESGDRRDSNGLSQMKDQLDGALLLQRRKKGFDGSSLIKNDMISTEDGVLPARASIGVFNETKLLITEKELNEWRLNSGKDDSSESFETASKDLASVSSSSNGNYFKKCRQWSKLWNLWGLLHRKKGEQCPNEAKLSAAGNGSKETRSDPDRKLVRSHSATSSRGSSSTAVGSARGVASRTESNVQVRRRQEDAVLERNRSSKFSPNHFDNGLLRFYLTPLRSRRRSKLGRSRLKNSPSVTRSMHRW